MSRISFLMRSDDHIFVSPQIRGAYACEKPSTIRPSCPGYRETARRGPWRASKAYPATSGVTNWCKVISRPSCHTNPVPSTAMIWVKSALRNVDGSHGICRTISAACHLPGGRKSSNGYAGSSSRAQPTITATRLCDQTALRNAVPRAHLWLRSTIIARAQRTRTGRDHREEERWQLASRPQQKG